MTKQSKGYIHTITTKCRTCGRDKRFTAVAKSKRRTKALAGAGAAYTTKEKIMPKIVFTVPGTAKPQGSKKAFRFGNRFNMVESCKDLAPWRDSVTWYALQEMQGESLLEGPLCLIVTFYFVRPKSHYKKSGGLTKSAPVEPCIKPDLSKLVRAVEDAMTSIVYRDDSQIVRIEAAKAYGESACTQVEVWEW